jgi:hypothetical protein
MQLAPLSASAMNNCAAEGRETLDALFSFPEAHELNPKVIEKKFWNSSTSVASKDHFLTAEAFQKNFPHDRLDSSKAQTWIKLKNEIYQIEDYDVKSGRVSLGRNDLVSIKLSDYSSSQAKTDFTTGSVLPYRGSLYQNIGLDIWHLKDADKVMYLAKKTVMDVPLSEVLANASSKVSLPDLTPFFEKLKKLPTTGKNELIPLLENKVVPVSNFSEYVFYRDGLIPTIAPNDVRKTIALPDDHFIKVEWADKSFKAPPEKRAPFIHKEQTVYMQLKDFTPEMGHKIFRVTALDEKNPTKIVAQIKSGLDRHGRTILFDLSPVDSHVYTFKLGPELNAKQIKVYAPKSGNVAIDTVEKTKIEAFLNKIPLSLKDRIDVIRFDPSGLDSNGFAGSFTRNENGVPSRSINFYNRIGKSPVHDSVVSNILSRPNIHETLWHELIHHLQKEETLYIPNFDPKIWEDAMVKDQAWVSKYAMVNSDEDEAETGFNVIETDGGRFNPQLRSRFKNKFNLLLRFLSQNPR